MNVEKKNVTAVQIANVTAKKKNKTAVAIAENNKKTHKRVFFKFQI